MDIKVDLGDNTTQLIEQLATQLNMTVNKVFPYYVEMISNIAVIKIVVASATILIAASFSKWAYKKVEFNEDDDDIKQKSIIPFIVAVISFVVLVITFVQTAKGAPEVIATILTPEPYAIKALVADAGKLIGK